jgi:hypothetical protein
MPDSGSPYGRQTKQRSGLRRLARGAERWLRYECPRPWLRIRRGRRTSQQGDRRVVLLVAHNDLMFGYLNDLRGLFAHDTRITFTVGTPMVDREADRCRELAGKHGLSFVDRRSSIARWWDLAVFADHRAAHRFPPMVPKLRIQHALSGGKKIRGRQYRYDPERLRYVNRRPLYNVIFDASQRRKEETEAELPWLEGSIRVVGDLRVDAMLSMRVQRDAIRAQLGIAPGECLVLLCSTWGPEGLLVRHGLWLADEARKLEREGLYRFAWSAHPLTWSSGTAAGVDWPTTLRGFRDEGFLVVEPNADVIPMLIACDQMLADHTS